MRYPSDHKETTRRRVVEVASARFRKDGLDGVGVATLMGDAGLTHGGFYSHFASKNALIEEVVETGMEDNFERVVAASKEGGIEGLIRYYLRPAHLQHPERGCPAAALGTEIHRQPREIREAFTRKAARMVAHIDSLLPVSNVATAQAIFSLLVGTMLLARSTPDSRLSDQILESGATAAIALARGGG